MGDRGNVRIRYDDGKSGFPEDERYVYFYSHWNGSDLPAIVQKALAREQRWDDPPYLARIIFCELIGGDVAGEGGYGIDARIGDNSHPVITVNTAHTRVEIDGFGFFSFEEFVALDVGTTFARF